MSSKSEMPGLMLPVYSPITESEAAVISATLEAHEIPFFIRGGGFSKLYPGMQIKDYNTQMFMVPAECYGLARELLTEFIRPSTQEVADVPKKTIGRMLRILLEALYFGWVIPSHRWQKNDE